MAGKGGNKRTGKKNAGKAEPVVTGNKSSKKKATKKSAKKKK